MSPHIQREVSLSVSRRGIRSRRDFLRVVGASAAAAAAFSWREAIAAQAETMKRRGKACILLWMQGGPSQFETFDPKPNHANGGETKAISTSVAGIELADNLPELAKVMEHVCLVRSMTSREGSHPRGTFLMHTSYLPTASVQYPTLGSVVAKELGEAAGDLPAFVRIGARGGNLGQGGFLGASHNPFSMRQAGRLPDNARPAVADSRFARRMNLLGDLEELAATEATARQSADHRALYDRAAKLITSPQMQVFDLEREPRQMRDAYGRGDFGAGCLLARRLVEAGVPFVEVGLGNWDTHQDNFNRSRDLCGRLDRPFAQLVRDLNDRGLLQDTLVVCLGEFGRTPRINANAGRDHYPRAFSLAMAGGGTRGGHAVGSTNENGTAIKDRPVSVQDLFQTIYHCLGIDGNLENMSGIGRPIKVVDGGKVVKEILG